MKIYIYVISALAFSSYAKASSPGCWTDKELLKENSLKNRRAFNISIKHGLDRSEVAVNFSAPKQIDGVKLKRITAYGENSEGKLIYLIPVESALKNNRFVSGYAISSDLIDNSYIEFSYEKCGLVFTYPID